MSDNTQAAAANRVANLQESALPTNSINTLVEPSTTFGSEPM